MVVSITKEYRFVVFWGIVARIDFFGHKIKFKFFLFAFLYSVKSYSETFEGYRIPANRSEANTPRNKQK